MIKSMCGEGADTIMMIPDNNQNNDAEDSLREKGIYYITGEIEPNSLLSIQQDILLKHLNPKWEDDIQIFINSCGGSCSETWALIDLLDFVKMDVWTTTIGEALSAGASILAAGTKGKRRATPNASIMVHTVAGGIFGNTAQIAAQAKALEQEHRRDIRFWITRTNLTTEKELREKLLLDVDNFLTPEQALAFGIIDEVLGSQKVVVEPLPVQSTKTEFPIKISFQKETKKQVKQRARPIPASQSTSKGKKQIVQKERRRK